MVKLNHKCVAVALTRVRCANLRYAAPGRVLTCRVGTARLSGNIVANIDALNPDATLRVRVAELCCRYAVLYLRGVGLTVTVTVAPADSAPSCERTLRRH